MKNTPDKDHIYGLYDPEGSGHTFYATEKERDDAAEEVIKGYLDDTWLEEVEGIFAFTVTTKATQVDVKHPEGELDEAGFDENGDYWESDVDFSCNYALRPLTTMTDLPLTTDLSDLPIGTLLRRRDGQVRKMVAKTSNHPDEPIVLDDGYCVAKNGKASNWPINDIIGIAAWPSLDRPCHYFVAYVELDAMGREMHKGQLFYKTVHGSPVTDDQFLDRLKQHIKKYSEGNDLYCIITNFNEIQP